MVAVIGVIPGRAYADRPKLFAALAVAFPVRFLPVDTLDPHGLDGVMTFEAQQQDVAFESITGPRSFTVAAPAPEASASTGVDDLVMIDFGRSDVIDGRLRGRSLAEVRRAMQPLVPSNGEVVLAQESGQPVWTAKDSTNGRAHRVAVAPKELRAAERLKDHLAFRDFLGLVPLVHFLREITGFAQWQRPPIRASFILDDPNLHWPTYGYISYPQLADHAVEHGYHVGIAMLPLDAAIAHPRAVRLFRERTNLSLLVHGNDHVKRELDRPSSLADPLAVAAQAIRRVVAFEARTDTEVCRVMVPPHDDYQGAPEGSWLPPAGACSEEMMFVLRRLGFEGVCYWGPSRTAELPELVGWDPADVHFGGGLPGFHRMTFDAPSDELVLRSFLDQPLVLFGHHEDLANNLDILAGAAARVSSLGEVEWGTTAELARSNYFTRVDGDVLRVRSYADRIILRPDPVSAQLILEPIGALSTSESTIELSSRGNGGQKINGVVGAPVRLPATTDVDLAVLGPQRADAEMVPAPPWRPWPLVRRCLTEGRDRAQPIAGQVRGALKR